MELGKRRKVTGGHLYDAYFKQEGFLMDILVKNKPTTKRAFIWNGGTYIVMSYDHFNGHFSGFRDRNAIYGLYISKLKQDA